MEKNYNNCPFKLMMPTITELDGQYIVNFAIMGKVGGRSRSVILQEIELADRLNNCFKLERINKRYEIKGGISRREVEGTLARGGRNCFFAAARLKIVFFDEESKKQIIIYFVWEGRNKSYLEGICYQEVSQKEIEKIKPVVRNEVNQQEVKQKESTVPTKMHVGQVHPFIQKYQKAITKEMNYLKNQGGREYKVTHGKLVSAKASEYAYVFELETELHLADSAPVRIRFQNSQSDGEVLTCEEFSIILIFKQNIGEEIPIAYISVEPWKLLKALNNKLELFGVGSEFTIAQKLINEGPYLSEQRPLEEIRKGQKEAILQGRKEPITIIWGPPGTGKTYTMSQLALDFQKRGKKVLIVSHSNVSVDGVIKKIVELVEEKNATELLKAGKILRYGYVRDEELRKHESATSFNYCINKYPELLKQKEILEAEEAELIAKGMLHSQQRIDLHKKVQNLRMALKQKEREVIRHAHIVATTISKTAVDTVFENLKYDVVMFDEVSMAYIPHVFMAACSAKEHFICVGDFRQLPPIAQSESKAELEQDIFSFLGIISAHGSSINYHPWLVMLHAQRRMHPKIARFASHSFYENLLKTEKTAAEKVQEITACIPFENESMIQIDLTGTYCPASKNNDNSRYNLLSAFVAFQTALNCEKKGLHEVGIITPYAIQTRLIKIMIEDYRKYKKTNIVCATIHQFQGSERSVIIFDAVESYPSKKPGILFNNNEGNNVTRLINVAVTRAKGKLITISHNRFWMNKLTNKAHPLYKLLKYQELNGKVLMKEEICTYLSDDKYRPMTFWRQGEYLDYLIEDIQTAKETIKISLPSGQLIKGEGQLVQALLAAIQRGVEVGVKCNSYEALPEAWKKISVGCDNAIFPLIIIDNTKTWYGAPEARTAFEDGNSKYLTISPTVVRFKGRRTTEMIGGLTEIDEVVVGNKQRSLLDKMQTIQRSQSIISKDRLMYFVQERYKCKKCKEALILKKSYAGKFYLGCSRCDHREYLTPELVNHYIMLNEVICREHNQLLEAKLGQKGVYIQCNCGMERHYFKADEI